MIMMSREERRGEERRKEYHILQSPAASITCCDLSGPILDCRTGNCCQGQPDTSHFQVYFEEWSRSGNEVKITSRSFSLSIINGGGDKPKISQGSNFVVDHHHHCQYSLPASTSRRNLRGEKNPALIVMKPENNIHSHSNWLRWLSYWCFLISIVGNSAFLFKIVS